MKNGKKGILIALALIVLLVTSFIIANSLEGLEQSRDASNAVSDAILPQEYAQSKDARRLVRKAAHLVEYAALGVAVMLLTKEISVDFEKKCYGTALFYVLAVAVADEHIQRFSDRTSSTGDIILDFCGAVVGFLAAWLVMKLYAAIRKKKHI